MRQGSRTVGAGVKIGAAQKSGPPSEALRHGFWSVASLSLSRISGLKEREAGKASAGFVLTHVYSARSTTSDCAQVGSYAHQNRKGLKLLDKPTTVGDGSLFWMRNSGVETDVAPEARAGKLGVGLGKRRPSKQNQATHVTRRHACGETEGLDTAPVCSGKILPWPRRLHRWTTLSGS